MAVQRVFGVTAEQAVPQGEVEAVVAVVLGAADGVVDAVHVGGYEDEAQPTLGARGEAEIGVVEHGEAVEEDFKGDDGEEGRAEKDDYRGFYGEGEEDFQRVKAQGGGGVQFGVGVVHAVNAPQGGDGVEEAVLPVDGEVQDY